MTPTTHVKRILGILLFSTVGFTLSFTSSNVVHRPFPTTRLEAGLLTNPFNFFRRSKRNRTKGESSIDADIIVVGGGVSGLTAAITAAAEASKEKIILVEATPELGGRVQSESTSDGFILDKGFAVFIEQYPQAQKILDLDALNLKPFLPGALIKLESNELARVSDPLREPGIDVLLSALLAPIGSFSDKLNLIPLILNVRTKSIQELFEEEELDTATALSDRWNFSQEIVTKFFKPFFEGIFLAPLSEQSSRMFSFVFKMFSEGAACLPEGGMGAVSDQLVEKARSLGVDIQTEMKVSFLGKENKDDETYIIEFEGQDKQFKAPCVILATDGQVAQNILSTLDGFENLVDLPKQPQRAVGCLYYTFKGEAPIQEPILILNGVSTNNTLGNTPGPINNICFPSVVNKGYAPEGYSLCSVCVLENAMKEYNLIDLDEAVRLQLATWFPDEKDDIVHNWELKKTFLIPNAQPSHYKGPSPANVNGGRPCNTFRGRELPEGLLLCGDHMATATLNGALESGFNAGKLAGKFVSTATK